MHQLQNKAAATWQVAGVGAGAVGHAARRTQVLAAAVPALAWFAVAAIALAPLLVVELTGTLGGLLASGQPVLVGPIDAAGVFVHWLGATGVRRGAWPSDVAGGLGHHRQVHAALIASLLLLTGAAVMALVMWRSMRVERLRDKYRQRGARWAQGRELAALHVKGPTPGRMILGRRGRQLLAAEDNASTLIIAPAQAGKTSGLAVPAMVEWTGPILATSVKGDLLVDTLAARRQIGEVKVFDPTDSTEVAGSAWSPVAAATTWSAARRVAASILQIGMRQHGGDHDSFWRQAGAAYLAPLLLAGNHLQASTADVLRWSTSTDESAVADPEAALEGLAATRTPGAAQALHDLQQLWGLDGRYRSSVIGTLSTHLDAWKEPELERATSADPDGITPEWLLDGNNTLYLSAPAAEQRRLRGLFCALVIEVVAAAFARAAKTGKPLEPRLLLMMDEAANIAPLPNIDEIASTGPGQGVLLCTILQNLSQAEEVWGKDRADTILANHRARLFGAGIADTATLEYIARILGDEARETSSISRKRAAVLDLGSRSESIEHRALLGHHETRQLKDTLLIYGRLPPTQVELRPWFKNPRLTDLVQGSRRPASPQGSSLSQAALPLSPAGVHSPRAAPAGQATARPTPCAQLPRDTGLDQPVRRPDATGAAPPSPPAGRDYRALLERGLGTGEASRAVTALRCATAAGDRLILTGRLASLLHEVSPPPAGPADAELIATPSDRELVAAALLRSGAAGQSAAPNGELWRTAEGSTLLVRYTDADQTLPDAVPMRVDGVGTVHCLCVRRSTET